MKKKDVEIGKVYRAKVSGQVVDVRVENDSPWGGWRATNLATGRDIQINTAARLRPKIYDKNSYREKSL